jgi:Tfp pilus assembly protein PilF
MRSKVKTALAFALVLAASAPEAARAEAGSPLKQALERVEASDYDAAEKSLLAIKGADESGAKLGLAEIAFQRGKYEDAEKLASQVNGSAQVKAGAVLLRARLLAATGKRADAIRLLEGQKSAPGQEGRKMRVLLGSLLQQKGKRADAEQVLLTVISDYNSNALQNDAEGLGLAGRAAHLLRVPKDANTLFNEAERIDKKQVDTLLARAELFLEKYDPGHAEEVLREALALSPKRPDLLVAMARVKLDQTVDFDAADKLVAQALAINPKHTGAYAVRAGVALRDMEIATAEAAVKAGLAIDPENTELLALAAASRFLDDDLPGFEAKKRAALAINPEYSEFFSIVAEFAEWEHRYDDIVNMMDEATRVDPDDGKAWANLGLTAMRNGDETRGLDAIRKAWSKDHFNVRVFNTLNLYEQTIPQKYETVDSGRFKIRYPKDERAVLERYMPRLAGEAWASMKARYAFVPKNPVFLELYGGREPFSVRTSGLPNIGIQGVCFGRVVAAMSPKSEPFNWGNVIWHELGHVFAIQLSKNHVPRWFTEGLSEYETIARRPEWQRELDPELYLAIKKGRLPGSVAMNRAFTHATNGQDVSVAYYASSQMMVFTVETFGMARVVKALELWGKGKRTPEVIAEAFGVPASEYDAKFRAWALGRLSRYDKQYVFDERPPSLEEAEASVKARPNDAQAHAELAFALTVAHKKEGKAALDTALKLDPKNPYANFLAAKIAAKDPAEVERRARIILDGGHDGYDVRMLLSEVAEAKKDKAAYRHALESAHRLDASRPDPLKGLLELALEDKREGDVLPLLRKLAMLEQHDARIWRAYTDKLVEAKAWDELVEQGEAAIFVDVERPDVHLDYARGLLEKGRFTQAEFEIESARATKAPPKAMSAVELVTARLRLAQGKKDLAQKAKDEAIKLDPENAEAKAFEIK